MFDSVSWYDDFFINSIRVITEPMTVFFKAFTNFGDGIVLVLIILGIFIFGEDKKFSLFSFINLINATIINTTLKLIFTRERPSDMLIEQGGYSYPSGHSFVSMAFYGFLIYLIFKSKLSVKFKYFFSTLLGLLILIVGISRIYLGVHYPSDVFSGFVCGLLYLLIFIEILEKKEVFNRGKKEKRKR